MKKHLYTILLMGLASISFPVNAQLGPLSSQYFQTPYLANPAMAGINQGVDASLGYRAQWSNMPGAPQQQALTVSYGQKRTGLGINLYQDRAGLLRQLRALASYAYHLPLAENQALHFGISLGVSQQRLATEDIKGSINDQSGIRFNQRDAYIDGDFGIAYTFGGFRAEAALPNLDHLLQRRQGDTMVDLPTFYAALGHRFDLGNTNLQLEPKVAYRGVKGFDGIIDAGTALWLEDGQLMLMGLYHSSGSATFGLGMDLKKRYRIGATYTTQTSSMNSYANGSFELGVGMAIGR